MIVQSGRYKEVMESGVDFKALVTAHESSMELVEMGTKTMSEEPLNSPKLPQSPTEVNGESHSLVSVKSKEGSKLIKEEERETGRISTNVYKVYCTEAYGWYGVAAVVFISLVWQGSLMAGDYWLAYETAAERVFNPSLFIQVYALIAAISFVLIFFRSFFVTRVGLKTADIYFSQILNSILHAPMSFFDTTPSGRILSRVIIHSLQCSSLSVYNKSNKSSSFCRRRLIRQMWIFSFRSS